MTAGVRNPAPVESGQPPRPRLRAGLASTLLTRKVGAPATAAAALVTIAALATATLLRPRSGYSSQLHLLGALALGTSTAVLVLLAAAAIVATVRKRRGRWAPPLRMVALAALAAALLLAAALQALHNASLEAAPARPAAAADFARWQQQVVPIVVSYIAAVRGDAAVLRHPPHDRVQTRRDQKLTREGAARLHHAATAVAAVGRTEFANSGLARLTRLLQTSLALAERGQAAVAAALALKRSSVPGRAALARARLDLRRSQQAMASFTLQANTLGGQLNAQQ